MVDTENIHLLNIDKKIGVDLSRKQKESNNRRKARIKVAKIHEKIAPSNYASSQLCSNCGNKSSQTKDLSFIILLSVNPI